LKKSIGPRALAYPTPVWVIGSYDKEGRPNVMTVAWAGVACSKPPCVGVSLRKATYTHACIMERRAFTVNIPSEAQAREADFFGIASGRDTDKFVATGLTPVRSDLVDAPYIAEFPLILECRVVHISELGLHTQFIGEIIDIKTDEELISPDGYPLLEKVKPIVYAPVQQRYFAIGRELGRGYALGKPSK